MSKDTLRLVQLIHPIQQRRIALVKEPDLVLLDSFTSIYELAKKAIASKKNLVVLAQDNISTETLQYDEVYSGKSQWKLLPAFDHPDGPLGCLVSGTGLTHKNSALNRQMMHGTGDEKPTDSIRMYQWGVEGGSPERDVIGTQPEWFYKGNGSVLRAHLDPLEIPSYADDGGEEPEIAGVYIIDEQGNPWRIGFCTGNEFSDHKMEKKNYLYLAPSKIRQCAIGPELVIDCSFSDFTGTVGIKRRDENIWTTDIRSGETNMAHSLQNLEYHHFKYASNCIPLQAHVHYFGADAFSFGKGIVLEDGDIMEIAWNGLGRPLNNPLKIIREKEQMLTVRSVHSTE